MERIEFFRHAIAEEDIQRAAAVLRSVFLTTGPVVAEFEAAFARALGAPHAVGLTSCTGALHLALLRAGVGPGDEVVTTPMTFVATATAVIECGARPVFADVCPRSGLLLPEDAEQAITPRTRALLPVHLYGRMADMRGFASLAARRGLALIEDAAHCVEGERDGVRPGQLSRAACFSFYATKALTCGEGGALVCAAAADADWYRSARHHGISRNAASRYTGPYRHWDMEQMGWKYNMDDVQAALLVGQVARLERQHARRRAIEALYRERLADVPGLDLIEPPGPGERSGHHLFTVLIPRGIERDAVLARLQAAGVGCAVNYRAVHTLAYFRETYGYAPGDFPVANGIGERTVSLPLYPALAEAEIERVCAALREAVAAR